jgi:hypothetical protein
MPSHFGFVVLKSLLSPGKQVTQHDHYSARTSSGTKLAGFNLCNECVRFADQFRVGEKSPSDSFAVGYRILLAQQIDGDQIEQGFQRPRIEAPPPHQAVHGVAPFIAKLKVSIGRDRYVPVGGDMQVPTGENVRKLRLQDDGFGAARED